jgi:predicted metal-dependent HD superfamily phosphohydrolase
MPMQSIQFIKDSWDQLTKKYCSNSALTDSLFNEIEKKYSARSRHYHNLQHIQALLELSQQYAHVLTDKDVVDFAIFYHDIIYNVLRKDNEQRSAGLAVKRLHALHVPEEKAEQVKIFIEATQKHIVTETVSNKADLELFLDFDMSILAAPWNDYLQYTQQIRKEYRLYPDKLYIPGRKQFLQQCLKADFIFHTAIFREKYEVVARENIRMELSLLR